MTVPTTTAPEIGSRLMAAASGDLAEHLARLGPVPPVSAAGLVALVGAAGLTGRGGSGFPTARKLAAVASGGRAVVVANGAEGEPASSKDRALLHAAPHLVLDGLALAARAVGADRAHVYAPPGTVAGPLARALAERRDDVPVTAVSADDTYLSGQESAVVEAVQGRRAVPATTPPMVFQRGVDGRPTLVQNVETLGHLALLARRGADWFRSVGTSDDPGTRLVTVSGTVGRPGVYEVAGGSTLHDVTLAAGGLSEPVQALLVGGYHGGWVPWTRDTAPLSMTARALAAFEASPGSGVVIALPERACGVRAAAGVVAYLAGQSAGQCGPCRHGLPAAAAVFTALADGAARPGAVEELQRLTRLVVGRGACHHPDGTARQIRSALRAFATEVDLHARGRCRLGPGGRAPW